MVAVHANVDAVEVLHNPFLKSLMRLHKSRHFFSTALEHNTNFPQVNYCCGLQGAPKCQLDIFSNNLAV